MRLTSAWIVIAALMPMARAADADCNRECLRGFITQYLLAMVAHTPGAVPVAPNSEVHRRHQGDEAGRGVCGRTRRACGGIARTFWTCGREWRRRRWWWKRAGCR